MCTLTYRPRIFSRAIDFRVLAVALVVLLSLPARLLCAQALNTGTVAGNVTDAQGSVIPGATVKLTSASGGATNTVYANNKGEYVFSDVSAGEYSLTVSAPTFQTSTSTNFEVNADQNVRLDVTLRAGSSAETVTVEAPSITVDTRSATVATVIDNNLVENLPIDGNNVVQDAALLPGVTNINAPTTFTSDTGGPTYNVSGARSNQNLFLLDGLFWNNNYYNTGLNFPPPYMIQELSVQLNNFKAQYGRNVGSVFNVLTRQGSNTIHGTLWEYIQNSALNAADYIAQTNPHLVMNQFGATMGGPIRRDKAFFFLGFQDLRLAGIAIVKTQTPSVLERGFSSPGTPRPCTSSQFAGMSCATFAQLFPQDSATQAGIAAGTSGLKNPLGPSNSYSATALSGLQSTWTSQGGTGLSPCVTLLTTLANTLRYLPNAEIPSICFNPVAVTVLNRYVPLPNFNVVGQLPFAVSQAKQPRNDWNGLARIDLNLPWRHTIDARLYMTAADDFTSNSSTSGEGVANYEIDNNIGGITSGNIGDTWVLRSNMLNVARLGYRRYNYTINPTDPTTGKDLGSNFTQPGHPFLPRYEASDRFTLGSSNSGYSYSLNAGLQFDDNFTWTHGNHNAQFGVQILDLDYIHRYDFEPVIEAEVQNTTISTADFLFGLPFIVTDGNSTNISAKQHAFYFYGQDDWRATRRLTINYGLRYELPYPWFQPDNQSITFIPGFQSKIFPQAPSNIAYVGDPGIDQHIVRTQYNQFAPRLGFVYDVSGNGRTAIRAGAGLFYDNVNANTVGIGQPYHYQATYNPPNGSFSQPLLGYPDTPPNYTNRASAQFVTPFSINYADGNLTTPYTMAFNVGIQQRIRSATLEINYIGKLGRHQLIPVDQNPTIYDCTGSYFQANPTLYCPAAASSSAQAASYNARVKYPNYNYGGQGIVDNLSAATSNYNGLQAIYTQRNRHGLSTVVSYTYSRSLDEQSNGATNTANVPTYKIRDNYGPSDFQATHVFNMGWVYNLPALHGGSAFARALLNDWTFQGIYNVRTGNPFTPTISGDRALTDSRTQRAQLVPGMNPNLPSNRHRIDKVNEWFNTAAFTLPAYGTYGNASRNMLYGPAYTQINFSVRRQVHLHEGIRMQVRADAFNVFNTPNLAQPQSSFSASATTATNVGQILSTVGTNGAATTNGRRVQLALIVTY